MAFGEGRGEARPAGAAFELGAALEQGQPAQAAAVEALALLGEEDAAERRFLAMIEQQMALVVGEAASSSAVHRSARRGQVESSALLPSSIARHPG